MLFYVLKMQSSEAYFRNALLIQPNELWLTHKQKILTVVQSN